MDIKITSSEEKLNIIVKCLYVLRIMIYESEKKGTTKMKSHSALLKNKVIQIKFVSLISKVDDFYLRLYANTTIWELKEIISKKISVAIDFIQLLKTEKPIEDTQNGNTLLDLNV